MERAIYERTLLRVLAREDAHLQKIDKLERQLAMEVMDSDEFIGCGKRLTREEVLSMEKRRTARPFSGDCAVAS